MATEETLANFTSITGASIEQAHFFLESSAGNLETAISSFYDSAGSMAPGATGEEEDTPMIDDPESDEEPEPVVTRRTQPSAPAPSAASFGGGRTLGGGNTLSGSESSPAPIPTAGSGGFTSSSGAGAWPGTASGGSSASSTRSSTPSNSNPFRSSAPPRVATISTSGNERRTPPPSRTAGARARVSTLRDIGNAPQASAPPSRGGGSDDEDDQQTFFTGGEKSGLAVENPNNKKNKGGAKNDVADMMKDLLEKAARSGERDPAASSGSGTAQGRSLFSGAAHTLGSDDTPSSFIPDPTNPTSSRAPHMPGTFQSAEESDEEEEGESVTRHLTFWSEGFSIEDGDLLRYDDPANAEILTSLNNGRAPLSLLNVKPNQKVELLIAKRTTEKYERGQSAPKGPFEGSGNRLGDAAVVPVFTSAGIVPAVARAGQDLQAFGTEVKLEVRADEPVTTLQIRLRDGTRMTARFNHTHTIGDVRRYINAASPPSTAPQPYVLMTTFPSKDLTDEEATLKDAGVLGSVIVQRGV